MNKIWLVIKREYLTRVRNKTFILSTILLPLFFIGFIVASAYFSIKSTEHQKIAVEDNNGMFKSSFQSDKVITYEFPANVNANNFKEKGYSAFLYIPKKYDSRDDSISLIANKQLGVDAEEKVRDQINAAIRNKAFLENNINKKVLDSINAIHEDDLYKFSTVIKQGDKTQQSNSGLSSAIGYGSGILIYITLFIYGAAVMRGVMEEKMNRIAEVIISSVKPFQLMAGKIIGIAAVGITQFLIWIVLIMVLTGIASSFISHDMLKHAQDVSNSMPNGARQFCSREFHECQKHFFRSGSMGTHHSMFPVLFYWWLFILCRSLCSCWQRCKRRSAGSAIFNASYNNAHHFIFRNYDYCRRKTRCAYFGLGKHDTIFIADCYDGTHSFWQRSGMANCSVNDFTNCRLYINHYARCKNLSHRYFTLRQKSNF